LSLNCSASFSASISFCNLSYSASVASFC
jgi:hypothetical protein